MKNLKCIFFFSFISFFSYSQYSIEAANEVLDNFNMISDEVNSDEGTYTETEYLGSTNDGLHDAYEDRVIIIGTPPIVAQKHCRWSSSSESFSCDEGKCSLVTIGGDLCLVCLEPDGTYDDEKKACHSQVE